MLEDRIRAKSWTSSRRKKIAAAAAAAAATTYFPGWMIFELARAETGSVIINYYKETKKKALASYLDSACAYVRTYGWTDGRTVSECIVY